MEREVGGGIGMGNTCKHIAVSFQCMTKSTTIKKKKVKKRKLKKKKGFQCLFCQLMHMFSLETNLSGVSIS